MSAGPRGRPYTNSLGEGTYVLALTLVGEFGVQPILASLRREALPAQVMAGVLRDRFATWHGVASGLYLIQSVLGAILVWLHRRGLR